MAAEILPGTDKGLLLLCDHASSAVPDDIDLGITLDPDDIYEMHIAVDVGAWNITHLLSKALDAPAILATVSRLVIDLHRDADHPGLIPVESDGRAIPGNVGADRAERIVRFYDPYHRVIADRVARNRPDLIVSIHSFTPQLASGGERRPWPIGILYNQDERAARLAIDYLAAEGIKVGDNEPYSGKLLNATLNRHAEAHGIPYLAIELRSDTVSYPDGLRIKSALLTKMIAYVRNSLASGDAPAT